MPSQDRGIPTLLDIAHRRGLLSVVQLFEIGRRHGQSPEAPVEVLLSEHLTEAEVRRLMAELEKAKTTDASARGSENTISEEETIEGTEPSPTRYRLGAELGRGGAGQVVEATDLRLGRVVALKTLHQGANTSRDRFLLEGRMTAQLEHPGIIPVYDQGKLPEGDDFYTMRIVKQRSLHELLSRDHSYTLPKLCSILMQASRAVAYAHSQGVIHRDLKPDNILVGDYGEVYVADWGLARKKKDLAAQPKSSALCGTPGYIAPELIMGSSHATEESDAFALGVVLYEIITGEQPFHGEVSTATLYRTIHFSPKQPRELRPECPFVLEEICLELLSKNPESRPSATELAQELEAYLEGSKERARKRQEARVSAAKAKQLAERYDQLTAEIAGLLTQTETLQKTLKPWSPDKRELWSYEEQLTATKAKQAQTLADANEHFSKALGYDPECAEARHGLATLYWSQLLQAEAQRNEPDQIFFTARLKEYDDGQLLSQLTAKATLTIESDPPGAEVFVEQYKREGPRLSLSPEEFIGATPLTTTLSPGSYRITLKQQEMHCARYPIVLSRGATEKISVRLFAEELLGERFVHIPAGPVKLGGDKDASNPLPEQEVFVPDFAISRYAVTFREYLAFINDLAKTDDALAKKRIPRDESGDAPYVYRDESGQYRPRYEVLIEGEGRQFCTPAQLEDLPVFSIDWFDAVAYCQWRSQKEGIPYRLLTEEEYEKAARGADGRVFPWGDTFDATFCKMHDSRPGFPQPEPVGSFPIDQSSYGVFDLVGGMRCWVLDIHGELSTQDALAESEPAPKAPRDSVGPRMLRGGAWIAAASHCRICTRTRGFSMARNVYIGFRIARTL